MTRPRLEAGGAVANQAGSHPAGSDPAGSDPAGSDPAGSDPAGSDKPAGAASSDGDERFEALRESLVRFLAADRKLRGRDGRTSGANPPFSQMRALFILLDQPEVTAGTLARVAEVNPASVTAMVDQLEAAGIVERRRDTEDRRAVKISLTEVGRAKVRAKERFVRERFEEYFAGVSPEEIGAAAKVLDRAASMLASFAEPAGEEEGAGERASEGAGEA